MIASDVTEGSAGNAERLAFLHNSDRVQPSGLVGEIVLPPMGDDPARQFARSPYFAGFTRAGTEFTLASVHVLWGKNAVERLPEVTAFAQWMRVWADRDNDWNQNLMVLSDFNLDRIGDPLYEAFINTGLWPPTELNKVPRTIFDDDNANHFYDQIAWFSEPDGAPLLQDMTYTQQAGSFDFIPHIMTAQPDRNLLADLGPLPALDRVPAGMNRARLAWKRCRGEDHWPSCAHRLWCVFKAEDPPLPRRQPGPEQLPGRRGQDMDLTAGIRVRK